MEDALRPVQPSLLGRVVADAAEVAEFGASVTLC